MNMLELQPDPEMKANKITYTYDQYDRVYLKNYYLGTVPRAIRSRFKGDAGLPSQNTIPKKLLYQDVYRYKSNTAGQPYSIDRIYQPVVSIPILTRVGSNITATVSVVCKSPIVQSGFIYSISNELRVATLYPGAEFWYSSATGNMYKANRNSGIGKLTWVITEASTIYLKAFCTMETGVLFSKVVTI